MQIYFHAHLKYFKWKDYSIWLKPNSFTYFLDTILFHLLRDHVSPLKFTFPFIGTLQLGFLNILCVTHLRSIKQKTFFTCMSSFNNQPISHHPFPFRKQTFYSSCVYLFFPLWVHFETHSRLASISTIPPKCHFRTW